VKIRGYLALGIICLAFPFFDLFQRTVVALYVRIRPSRRMPMMTWWIQLMRGFVLGCFEKIGGARLSVPERVVTCGPGTLIVMNHQSLLDIPLVVGTVRDGYPRIVTRRRYYRFIPLISHMVRLYQYPVVDPRAKSHKVKKSLYSLAEAAATSEVPIAIFPEGTRTPPGSTRRYKTGGARLAVRTGTPVVPIAVNSGEVWPRRAFLKVPGEITICIGKPISTEGRTADQVGSLVESWIETQMRRLAPHRYSGPYVGANRAEPKNRDSSARAI